jgi:hypothetical protein
MHVKEMGRADTDLIHLTQGRVHWLGIVNMIRDLRVQQQVGNFIS